MRTRESETLYGTKFMERYFVNERARASSSVLNLLNAFVYRGATRCSRET